jgi:ATP-binding cassette subfamily B protein
VLVVLLAVVSVTFAILGPWILGTATSILFDGVVSKQLPAGVTQGRPSRRSGQGEHPGDMLSSMHLTPVTASTAPSSVRCCCPSPSC